MGTNIQWLIERQHADGGWEAVLSMHRCLCLCCEVAMPSEQWHALPEAIFGAQDPRWSGFLSGVCGAPQLRAEPFAQPGLPQNASNHAQSTFGGRGVYRSPGHFYLGDFRAVVTEMKREHLLAPTAAGGDEEPEELQIARSRLVSLRRILARDETALCHAHGIIFGRQSCFTEDWPDMNHETAHHRLLRTVREEGLLPISGETVRVVIAYG